MIKADPSKMIYGCKFSELLELHEEPTKKGLAHFKVSSQELENYLQLYELYCSQLLNVFKLTVGVLEAFSVKEYGFHDILRILQ